MQRNNRKAGLLALSALILAGTMATAHAESAGQYIDDAAITTKVKAALLADSQLKATQVSVTTAQGVVQLSGAVADKNQETAAINDANKVDGVKSVQDLLSVKSSAPQSE
jgi:osmotically-inducible protein OsmY